MVIIDIALRYHINIITSIVFVNLVFLLNIKLDRKQFVGKKIFDSAIGSQPYIYKTYIYVKKQNEFHL